MSCWKGKILMLLNTEIQTATFGCVNTNNACLSNHVSVRCQSRINHPTQTCRSGIMPSKLITVMTSIFFKQYENYFARCMVGAIGNITFTITLQPLRRWFRLGVTLSHKICVAGHRIHITTLTGAGKISRHLQEMLELAHHLITPWGETEAVSCYSRSNVQKCMHIQICLSLGLNIANSLVFIYVYEYKLCVCVSPPH